MVLVNAPVDGVHVNGRVRRRHDHLQVCNDTAAPIASVTGAFPFLAFAP